MNHVVPISGGKDSTSTALWLIENEPRDYIFVCTPTGNELPDWYEHMKSLRVILGQPIYPVVGGTLKGIIDARVPSAHQPTARPIQRNHAMQGVQTMTDGKDHTTNPGFDGMRAKEAGIPVEDCPYEPSPQRTAWVVGWFIAKKRVDRDQTNAK